MGRTFQLVNAAAAPSTLLWADSNGQLYHHIVYAQMDESGDIPRLTDGIQGWHEVPQSLTMHNEGECRALFYGNIVAVGFATTSTNDWGQQGRPRTVYFARNILIGGINRLLVACLNKGGGGVGKMLQYSHDQKPFFEPSALGTFRERLQACLDAVSDDFARPLLLSQALVSTQWTFFLGRIQTTWIRERLRTIALPAFLPREVISETVRLGNRDVRAEREDERQRLLTEGGTGMRRKKPRVYLAEEAEEDT